MEESSIPPPITHQLRLVAAHQDSASLDQAAIDSLKVVPTQAQIEIRKSRCRRQGFVATGIEWRGVLLTDPIDRLIADELGMPFKTQAITLADEDEARLWILERVLEAPELNPFQRIRVSLQYKSLLIALGRRRMAAGGEGSTEMSNLGPHDTRAKIAKASRSSQGQVQKVEFLQESASPEVLRQLEAGEITIGAAFDSLRQLPASDVSPADRYAVFYLGLPSGLTLKHLRAIPVSQLAADDAAVFLWTHPSDLAIMLGLLRKWGFIYRTHFVLPLAKPLLRDFAQEAHDLLIFGTRGNISAPAVEDLPSSLLPPSTSTDRSDSVFTLVDMLAADGPRIQIYPRLPRTGWEEWPFPSSGSDEQS